MVVWGYVLMVVTFAQTSMLSMIAEYFMRPCLVVTKTLCVERCLPCTQSLLECCWLCVFPDHTCRIVLFVHHYGLRTIQVHAKIKKKQEFRIFRGNRCHVSSKIGVYEDDGTACIWILDAIRWQHACNGGRWFRRHKFSIEVKVGIQFTIGNFLCQCCEIE